MIEGKWRWSYISKVINVQEVWKHPDKPWDKEYLSQNRGITLFLIDTLVLPNATGEWNWYEISMYIDVQEVINNPHREWNRYALSWNDNMTRDIAQSLILPNATDRWDFDNIDYKSNRPLNMQEVILQPDKVWNRSNLSMRDGITVHLVDTLVLPNAIQEWNWRSISEKVPIQDVLQYPDRPWSRYGLSSNKEITIDTINKIDNLYV